MIIVTCLDDHNGMMFNHRRQSLDVAVRDDLLSLTSGKLLWMNEYSYHQFEKYAPQIRVEQLFQTVFY